MFEPATQENVHSNVQLSGFMPQVFKTLWAKSKSRNVSLSSVHLRLIRLKHDLLLLQWSKLSRRVSTNVSTGWRINQSESHAAGMKGRLKETESVNSFWHRTEAVFHFTL